jgi:hypothetical protein
MGSGNQGQRRGEASRARNNGGSRPATAPRTDFTEGLAHQAEHMAGHVRESIEGAREEMAQRYRRAEGAIARHPAPSVLIGFGLGFGIGLALTAILTQHEETWAERHLPDSFRDLPDSVARLRRRVPAAIQESHVADSFHQLKESIRDLPAAISRLIPGH